MCSGRIAYVVGIAGRVCVCGVKIYSCVVVVQCVGIIQRGIILSRLGRPQLFFSTCLFLASSSVDVVCAEEVSPLVRLSWSADHVGPVLQARALGTKTKDDPACKWKEAIRGGH